MFVTLEFLLFSSMESSNCVIPSGCAVYLDSPRQFVKGQLCWIALLSAAKNKGFIFSTDHNPSLLLMEPTLQSLPSRPIAGDVYFLPNIIICLNPTGARNREICDWKSGPCCSHGWMVATELQERGKKAVPLSHWGVKTQTQPYGEKGPVNLSSKTHLIFLKMYCKNYSYHTLTTSPHFLIGLI